MDRLRAARRDDIRSTNSSSAPDTLSGIVMPSCTYSGHASASATRGHNGPSSPAWSPVVVEIGHGPPARADCRMAQGDA